MHIVHIASEFSSLAKVGGLADVVFSLSKSEASLGHKVTVIIPLYRPLMGEVAFHPLLDFEIRENTSVYHARAYKLSQSEVEIIILDLPHPKNYFLGHSIYGDEFEYAKFVYFCKGALSFLHINYPNGFDVFHAHDWMTCAIFPLLEGEFHAYREKIKRRVVTIHNILYQGRISKQILTHLGGIPNTLLDGPLMTDPWDPLLSNLLKAGIEFSDAVSVVSPSYAKEILTPPESFGLEETLLKNRNKIKGILNGIDLDEWNLEKDPLIPFHASYKDSLVKITSIKEQNKQSLAKTFSLQIPPSTPQFCVITRLTEQKGLDLILKCIDFVVDKGCSFILLGSMIDEHWKAPFNQLKEKYLYHPKVFISYEFNEPLSHITFAASDFIVIPSIFEPCGLTQMIACRYGTIPIVRKTGGLKDTIFDIEDTSVPISQRNGLAFSSYEWSDLEKSLAKAIEIFHGDLKWTLLKNTLSSDFSWKNSTKSFLELYTS